MSEEILKRLNIVPLGMSYGEIARKLSLGQAVGVVLEPGDMTRYNIVLVGCWAPTIRSVCTGTGDGGDYILVSKVGAGCAPIGRFDHWTSFFGRESVTQNEHTAQVLAEFLGRVWKALGEFEVAW